MNKRKALYKLTEVMARQSRGAYWISFLQTYFDPGKIMAYSAWIKILIPQTPTVPLLIGAGIFLFLIEICKYFIGNYDEKKGIWKTQSEYNQKKEHLAPFNNELKNTLKEICKELKIEHKFTEL